MNMDILKALTKDLKTLNRVWEELDIAYDAFPVPLTSAQHTQLERLSNLHSHAVAELLDGIERELS